MGTFVVMKATIITINNETAASLVKSPIRIKMPQTISNEPVKYAQNGGLLNPIFANRPAPVASGVMYFCKPSERKIKPTTSRGMSEGILIVFTNLFIIALFEYLVTEWWSVWNFDLIKFKVCCPVTVVAGVCQQDIAAFKGCTVLLLNGRSHTI